MCPIKLTADKTKVVQVRLIFKVMVVKSDVKGKYIMSRNGTPSG